MMDDEAISRAVAAINNTARVADVSGDQQGSLGSGLFCDECGARVEPCFVVINPEQVARAVIAAISQIRLVDSTEPE